MGDIEFGEGVKDWERTRVENPITQIIMGDDVTLFKTHLTRDQRVKYEINKFLESFAPISELPGDESIRLELLKRVADLPDLQNVNPEAFAVTLAFFKLYGSNIKGNMYILDNSPWKSRQYKKSDILRYLRYLSRNKIVKLQ